MTATPEQILQARCRLNPAYWFALHGVIKDRKGKIEAKRQMNVVQQRLVAGYCQAQMEGLPFAALGLKPRKVGLSTGVNLITYHHMRGNPGLKGALMADKGGTADVIFEMFRTFAENDTFDWGDGKFGLPKKGEPGNLAHEIVLPNGSTYVKQTAGSARAGAGDTFQVANGTEVAWFPKITGRDPALGFMNAWVADTDVSLGVFESTPAGPSGFFYDLWQDKTNGFYRVFAAWFEFPEYATPFAGPAAREAFAKSLHDAENRDYEELDEIARFGVSLEQLNWRRDIIKKKCQNDVNRFRQEYPSDEKTAFLQNARLRFKAVTVDAIAKRAGSQPVEVGELSMQNDQTVSWARDDAGTIEIAEHPRIGLRYLVSMDTCTGRDQQITGGKADPDWHSIGVLRDGYTDPHGGWVPPKIVAHHYSRLESEYAALVAASLSIYYGRCIVIPEVNNCGLYHVKALEEMSIPLYERTHVNKVADTVDRMKGWKTDVLTRRTIIDNLAAALAEWTEGKPTVEIPFQWIIDQMASFIRRRDGHAAAMPGKHDDGVMMLAIALENRSLCQVMKEPRVKRQTVKQINERQGWR